MSSDFVFTIADTDKVTDLDNDKGGEMNPDFQFEADSDFAEIDEDSEGDEDELDEILKRRNATVDGEEDEEKDEEESSEEENDEEKKEKEEEEEGESDKEEEDAEPLDTVENDRTGFFADDEVATTVVPFQQMNLSRPLLKGITEAKYVNPTPIQNAVIPVGLLGKDIVAGAVTGSGKTAAYLIPILERLVYRPLKTPATRVVILAPTRELAVQVHEVGTLLGKFIGGLRFGLAVGGLNLRVQEQELRSKPDIVVATPGRFIDHVRNSPSFSCDQVEVLVLDEADRMLEEGFEAELTEILKLIPMKRQTMLFSATMNSNIQDLVKLSLKKPVRLMMDPPKQAASGLKQEFIRIRKQHEKSRPAILVQLLKKIGPKRRTIVFVAQKVKVHRLRVLLGLMGIKAGELHGALTQEQRMSNMRRFKSMDVSVLVCTDLAARGLDIANVECVINYELPLTFETYLHRIGRSARAGRTGTAISLVGEGTNERQVVKSAVQSAKQSTNDTSAKQTILGRKIDWDDVKKLDDIISQKQPEIDEVMEEVKAAKEMHNAEKELLRAENLVNHRQEIMSRPKRTWFEADRKEKKEKEKEKKGLSNTQKKKMDKGPWAYKKTKVDRKTTTKRGGNRMLMKSGARKARKINQ
ncbi:putative ATP-dependent RNA helicase [Starmerella bacillaris]|uniref:ATP-dependent RNA helicase DRS1 n=1 Tax=Starmerella bacillaris TaxID=1247836 RepID=A0AAV5RH01_STABA|nr:putative ATP-dependent RNA helicase [Starmerella bacillaris]